MKPPHEPTVATRARVEALAQYGIPQAQIAVGIEVSEPTLRKYYADELQRGKLRASRAVAENLFAFASGAKGAPKDQVTAAIFWCKTQLGFRETVDVNANIVDSDGAAARLAAAVASALAKSAGPVPPAIVDEPHPERLN